MKRRRVLATVSGKKVYLFYIAKRNYFFFRVEGCKDIGDDCYFLHFGQTNPLLGREGRVKVDSFRVASDGIYFSRFSNPSLLPSLLPNSTHIRNLVSVSIEEDSKIFIQRDFSATLVLHITKYDDQQNIYDEFDSSFTVNYVKAEGAAYNASARLLFENAFEVLVVFRCVYLHNKLLHRVKYRSSIKADKGKFS